MSYLFSNRPLVRILFLFITGILMADLGIFPVDDRLLFIIFPLAGLFAGIGFLSPSALYRYKTGIGLIVQLNLILAGGAYTQIDRFYLVPSYLPDLTKPVSAIATITEAAPVPGKWAGMNMELKALYMAGQWHSAPVRLSAFIRQGQKDTIHAGDLLMFHSEINEVQPPMNPEEFDYREYLLNNDIRYQVFLDSTDFKRLRSNFETGLAALSGHLKEVLTDLLLSAGLSADNRNFLMALLLGEKDRLEKVNRQAYSAAGVMHIMAVSGLHVGTLYLLCNLLFGKLLKLIGAERLKVLPVAMVIWCYACLTGWSPSVCRACIMLSFIICGQLMRRKTDSFNLLAGSALLLLLYEPGYLFNVGFQLSYSAVSGILLIYPLLYETISFRYDTADKVWSLACVSLAAQIGTFPVSVFYFHQFPVYFLPANLLIVPLAILIFYLGIVLLLFLWFNPVAGFLATVLNKGIDLLNAIVVVIDKLPHAVVSDLYISSAEVIILYLIMCFLLGFFLVRQKLYLFSVLVCIVSLLGYRFISLLKISGHKALIVYAVKGSYAIEYYKGRNCISFQDTTLAANRDKQSRMMGNYRLKHGIREISQVLVDSTIGARSYDQSWVNYNKGKAYIQVHDYRILILDKWKQCPEDYPDTIKVDILLLRKGAAKQIDLIDSCIQYSHLVLDLSDYSGKTGEIEEKCKERGVPFHDMKKDGALIIK